MYTINDEQVDYILDDIRRHGIGIEDLQQNLLDHICILVEENLEENGDFEKFYASVIPSFYRQEMREIEEEALFLLRFKAPYLVLSRNQFFGLLFAVFIGPFIWYALNSLATNSMMTIGYECIPVETWLATLVLALHPLLILVVLFFTPEQMEPLIPRGARVLLGIRPFVRILPATGALAETGPFAETL
ncbi:MAG TPA: hypothetical protein VGM30_05370 [Puia sp.]|jgi:hypothetical protein